MINRLVIISIVITALFFSRVFANDAKNSEDNTNNNRRNIEIVPPLWSDYNGLKLNLSDDGKSYLKAGFFGQFWLRHAALNPGSVDTEGNLVDHATDMAFRRMRIHFTARLFDKVHFYTQIGTNNQTFRNGNKPQVFFHDFWMSYEVAPEHLNIGAGLNLWTGVSRLTNASSVSKMMLEYPSFIFHGLGRTDQAGRQMGVFAFGNYKGFNYRLSIGDPFEYSVQQDQVMPDVAYEIPSSSFAYKGYVTYNFLDKEIPGGSFMPMTYLGKKRIFNVGFGFDVHPNSMAYYSEDKAEVLSYTQKHFGVDVFMELPQSNGSVLSLYSVGLHDDFGPNYLRSMSIMNTHGGGAINGEPLAQGGGVNEWMMGTGNIWYTSLGFVLPKKYSGKDVIIQPVLATTFKDFNALSVPSWQYDAGVNYYLYGHNFKVTGQYSSRPVYQGQPGPNGSTTISENKGMFIIQVQVAI